MNTYDRKMAPDTLRRRLQEVLGHDELPDDDGLIADVAEWIRIARALSQPVPGQAPDTEED